jgi:hypothetical protein
MCATRRNHQLGHTGRKGAHGKGDQRRAAGAAQANHGADVIATLDQALERSAHGGDCSSPVAGEYGAPALRVVRRDVFGRKMCARGDRTAQRGEICQGYRQSGGFEQGAYIVGFVALGVEGGRNPDSLGCLHVACGLSGRGPESISRN